MKFTFKIIKKNQILLVATTLMLVVAGYLNYTYDPNRVFDVELTGIIEENLGDAVFVDSKNATENSVNKDNSEETAKNNNDDYFIQTRMDRTNSFAKQLEMYENMIKDNKVSEEQKKIAQEEMKNINNLKNAITISENLIKLKGIKELVILSNNGSVNVVVKGNELTSKQIAQIQNIATREFKANIDDIHITLKEN